MLLPNAWQAKGQTENLRHQRFPQLELPFRSVPRASNPRLRSMASARA